MTRDHGFYEDFGASDAEVVFSAIFETILVLGEDFCQSDAK